jgi:hypothetical protein
MLEYLMERGFVKKIDGRLMITSTCPTWVFVGTKDGVTLPALVVSTRLTGKDAMVPIKIRTIEDFETLEHIIGGVKKTNNE